MENTVGNNRNRKNNNKLVNFPSLDRRFERSRDFSMEQNYDNETTNNDLNNEIEQNNFEQENNIENNETINSEGYNSTPINNPVNMAQNLQNKANGVVKKVASAKKIIMFIAANPWIWGVIAGIIMFLIIILSFVGTSQNRHIENETNGIVSSSCGASSPEANLATFVGTFEGTTPTCDANGVEGYLAIDIGDGTVTIGPGITLAAVPGQSSYIMQNRWERYFHLVAPNTYNIQLNDCIPKPIIDKIKLRVLEGTVDSVKAIAANNGVDLTSFQIDALASYQYNGCGGASGPIRAYVSGGLEAMWNVMKNCTHDGYGNDYPGLYRRRKAEFALFVTGDYTDQGLFYSRPYPIPDYDNYNSEDVMSRRLVCVTPGTIDINTQYSIDPNAPLYSNLTTLEGKTFESLLKDNNITIEEYNSYLEGVVKKSSNARSAVVNVAVDFIGSIANMGYKLGYYLGGKYYNTGVNGNWGPIYYNRNYKTTPRNEPYSFDCTGFTAWAVMQAKYKYPDSFEKNNLYSIITSINSQAYLRSHYDEIHDLTACESGDLFDLVDDNFGHQILVIKNDKENETYIVAESNGELGVVLSYYSYDRVRDNDYKCFDLKKLYNQMEN